MDRHRHFKTLCCFLSFLHHLVVGRISRVLSMRSRVLERFIASVCMQDRNLKQQYLVEYFPLPGKPRARVEQRPRRSKSVCTCAFPFLLHATPIESSGNELTATISEYSPRGSLLGADGPKSLDETETEKPLSPFENSGRHLRQGPKPIHLPCFLRCLEPRSSAIIESLCLLCCAFADCWVYQRSMLSWRQSGSNLYEISLCSSVKNRCPRRARTSRDAGTHPGHAPRQRIAPCLFL